MPVVLYGRVTWSLILREENRLVVFENRVVRKIFGPKGIEVTRKWKRLHNENLHDLALLTNYFMYDQIKNEEGETYGMCGGKEECVEDFDGET
jgi:hypothetical protein